MERKKVILLTVLITTFILFSGVRYLETFEELVENEFIKHKLNETDLPSSLIMYQNIEKYSDTFNIPKHILYNIAYKETTYRGPFDWEYKSNRTSKYGALGPMQIMPITAKHVHGKTINKQIIINDIEFNIRTSSMLLSDLYEKHKDWNTVCGIYNTGKKITNKYSRFCSENVEYIDNWVNLPTQ